MVSYHPTRRQANGFARSTALDAVRLAPELVRVSRARPATGIALGLNAAAAREAIACVRRNMDAIRKGYASATVERDVQDALAMVRRARRLHSAAMARAVGLVHQQQKEVCNAV